MVIKHTVDYHPSPSQLISKIQTPIFLWTPKGFISSESSLNFFLNLYIPPWLRKRFKFIVLQLLQIHLWVKKLNLFNFTQTPKQNSPPGFYIIVQADGNCQFLANSVFWRYFFLRRKGERIVKLKKIPKLTKVSVTSFDKFHHLCILCILVYVLLCIDLASSILKYQDSLT